MRHATTDGLLLVDKPAGVTSHDAVQLNRIRRQSERWTDLLLGHLTTIVDVLVAKSLSALQKTGLTRLVVAGGVGANKQLRAALDAGAARRGFEVFYPEIELCTDNGAMIAFAAALRWKDGLPQAETTFSVLPRWELA